jgi:pimeloyl-ACP methyl ester carboxylesterase
VRHDEPASITRVVGAGLGGLTTLVQRTHDDIRAEVYQRLRTVLGPVVTPIGVAHRGIDAAAYGAVRVGVRAGTYAATTAAATARGDGHPMGDTPSTALALSFVQGLFGDRFADEPVAFRMSLRANGIDVAATAQALREAYPAPSDRVVVMLHGLMETDESWCYRGETWHGDPKANLGAVLQQHLGLTPVLVRYNTGIRISHNGIQLAGLLQELVEQWPVPVTELVLIGHSMGGLVSLSALHQHPQARWARLVTSTVTLASPHRGSMVERGAGALAHGLQSVAHVRWLTDIIRARSGGIRDLAHGNLFEQDWLDRPADTRDNHREVLHLPPGIHHYRVVAAMGWGRIGRFVGDGLVSVGSAMADPSAADEQICLVRPAHHFDVLNHPKVHEQVLAWLGPPAPTGSS